MATSFKIADIKCTELPNLEKKGAIDPYVIFEYLGVDKKTEKKDNELNPTFGEVFEFDLSGKALGPEDFIEVTVKDHEKIGRNRLVGKATISLTPLLKPGSTSAPFSATLNDSNGRPTTGKITFRIDYAAPAGAEGAAGGGGDDRQNAEGDLGDADGDEDATHMPDGTPIPPGPEGDEMRKQRKVMKRKRRQHNLPDKPTDFQVRVKIIEGRHLPGGNINPTVRITVGEETKQTRVKHSSNKPHFDETFFFNFNERPNDMFDKLMNFEVFNAKSLMSDALLGTFHCDVGLVYDGDGHAIIRKWLLMTAPEDKEPKEGEEGEAKGSASQPGGPPAGYLKITAFVLGPGDEIPDKAKGGGKAEEEEDIESNLLRPAGVSLRPATFLVKIYRAEDLPQMDTAAFDGVKKLFSSGPPKDHVDPYAKFTFAGQKAKTDIKYGVNHPEFNQELRVSFKFPSMCERLKLQFFDWDRVGNDDCIGTTFIPLSAISGMGDDGFLPSFGPCFVNMYGSLREFSNLPDEYDDLNNGRGEGVAYRGRALVEIDTRFGNHAEKPVHDIMAQELLRVQTYMRRRKYKLFASFLSANMIAESDGPVEFEVSIGNYGNKLDSTVTPQSSSTPPTNPVFDGANYYYLPWNETKPCCVVESHWEDIAFRLEPINMLEKLIDKLMKNIDSVNLAIKAKSQPAEIAALLIALLDQLISDCRTPLPAFDATMNGVNELDLKMQEIRQVELANLVDEATTLREQATDIHEAMEVIDGYLGRVRDLCIEPQNSMPDVVISMISGSKRIAYFRIPANAIMYSKNPAAKGINCAKLQNIIMKYPGKKGKDVEDHPEVPAILSGIFWLGLEADQAAWTDTDQMEGEYSVYAETYENQIDVPIVDWTSKGCPRPAFSDAEGDIRLNKESFVPPKGWKWDDPPDGEWFVDPELSANYDADAGHKVFVQDAFENESCVPGGNWGTSTIPYTNIQGDQIDHRDETKLPEGWVWVDDWKVDVNRACDEEGWEYCVEATLGGWTSVYRSYHLCRRRRFVRTRRLEQDPEKLRKKQKDEAKRGEGWEYAPVFGMKYHLKERKLDMVRRRRWHRKMVNTEPGAPPVFSIQHKDKDKPPVQYMPRIFLAYDNPHKWQLRSYLYQARDILGLDSEGVSDAYAKVCFQNVSENTRVVKETLCPDWDQTLLFEDMSLFGSPKVIAENPPYVTIELFDKDRVGKDEYLGRCFVQPMVRLNGSKPPAPRLMWYDVMRGERQCGELLAAFELFLDEGADLPFPPPMKDNRYIVPNGIRPVMVRTGVEILCWGVRNMKKYQLASCTSPSATFEIGGQVIVSDTIKNTKKNPNFSKNIFFADIYLPKDPLYMPPVNIKIRDHRTFGRKPVVGRHIIKSLDFDPPPKADPPAELPVDPVGEQSKQDVTLDIEEKQKKKEIVEEQLDWWSKYFASIGETAKCGDFLEKGHQTIQIYRKELEEVQDFGGFGDFVKSYPLERGKEDDEEDDNVVGEFKGLFKIYPLPPDPNEKIKNKYFSKVKDSKPVPCTVRVYIIRGIELQPKDPNGKADPFIEVELGNKKISDKDNYIPNEINPYFGAYFELKATIPLSKDLKIKVMDYDLLTRNDLIGETVIDLENRYLSKARPTCGLPPAYYTSGPYQWRDQKSPVELLNSLCKSKPQYLSQTQVVVNGELIKLEDFEETPPTNPHLGPPDQRLALHVLNTRDLTGFKLVPEHIETRSLRNPLQPSMDQGQLEMFVDIFPLSQGQPGPPLNIEPRKPKDYHLRCIIWNTADVPPSETSITGEEMSDLYVKGWMEGGEDDKEKTDVHYRSMDGEGMFNWRMCFPFKYMPEEKVMVVEKKEHFWSLDATRQLLPPRVNIQVWDNDLFSANDFIGNLELDLSKLPRPKKQAKKCNLAMLEDNSDTMDLFSAKSVKGWWILVEELEDGTRKEQGKIEMTLEIVSDQEAQEKPAGQGREEPNMHPKLEEPNRPDTSFLWFTSPWKTLKYIIWRNYKWYIIGFLIFLIVLAFIVLFLYSVPGNLVRKVFGT
ncbi:myoferlin-like [Hydractinia symbiolongicarpus]|uniref:myoferlin-like n=1 Tax=Hydractinia symbiolongicarpus TaxID=13093 RepID=UPI00254BCC3A|nr:myoferlin-like [Hydractinia symbiolongicarpus]